MWSADRTKTLDVDGHIVLREHDLKYICGFSHDALRQSLRHMAAKWYCYCLVSDQQLVAHIHMCWKPWLPAALPED